MSPERFLLDTVFIQAMLNERDAFHQQAMAFLPRVLNANEVWITDAVLIEVGDGLSAINRPAAVEFIQECYHTPNIHVVPIDRPLLNLALTLYQNRPDKIWGLTDCISFIVMNQHDLTDAVTNDRHFVQAGYRALLVASP